MVNYDKLDRLPLEKIRVTIAPVVLEQEKTSKLPEGSQETFAKFGALPGIDESGQFLRMVESQDTESQTKQPDAFTRQEAFETSLPVKPVFTLKEDDLIGEARRLFQETGWMLIPILTAEGKYSGACASRQELLGLIELGIPPRIGGMATPLGVYMTSGIHTSGSGVPGLVTTGMGFAGLVWLLEALYVVAYSWAAAYFPQLGVLQGEAEVMIHLGFVLSAILLGMRLTPMSGLHAAEHMTINALEEGLDIREETVRNQPREHKRCGTNLMVLLMGVQVSWLSWQTMQGYVSAWGGFFYLFAWVWIISVCWRPVGLWIQNTLTTKDPSDWELASGMHAGQELMDKYRQEPHEEANIFQRIWASGLIHILLSFLATHTLIGWGVDALLQ